MSNGDVFRVTLEGSYPAIPVTVNHVLWFQQKSATPVASESDTLADDVAANVVTGAIGNKLRLCQTPLFSWQRVRCQKMLFDFEPPVVSTVSLPVAGTGQQANAESGTLIVPSICCVVIRLLSTLTGRSGQGRIYVGGIASATSFTGSGRATCQDGARWHSSLIANLGDWINSVSLRYNGVTALLGGTGMTAQLGVWSRKNGGASPPFNIAGFTELDGFVVTPEVRLQRSREYGVSRRHAGRH